MARLRSSERACDGDAPSRRWQRLNYAPRQEYRRLSHAGTTALAGLLLLAAVGLGLNARRWVSLAGRSRVGAGSEDEVQRALAPLGQRSARARPTVTGLESTSGRRRA
jgi:hypothetical protein